MEYKKALREDHKLQDQDLDATVRCIACRKPCFIDDLGVDLRMLDVCRLVGCEVADQELKDLREQLDDMKDRYKAAVQQGRDIELERDTDDN